MADSASCQELAEFGCFNRSAYSALLFVEVQKTTAIFIAESVVKIFYARKGVYEAIICPYDCLYGLPLPGLALKPFSAA
jgi:hypothetical protein